MGQGRRRRTRARTSGSSDDYPDPNRRPSMVRATTRRRGHRRLDRQSLRCQPPNRQRLAETPRPASQPPAVRPARHGRAGRRLRHTPIHAQAGHPLPHLPSGDAHLAIRGWHRARRKARPTTARRGPRSSESAEHEATRGRRSPTTSGSRPRHFAVGSHQLDERRIPSSPPCRCSEGPVQSGAATSDHWRRGRRGARPHAAKASSTGARATRSRAVQRAVPDARSGVLPGPSRTGGSVALRRRVSPALAPARKGRGDRALDCWTRRRRGLSVASGVATTAFGGPSSGLSLVQRNTEVIFHCSAETNARAPMRHARFATLPADWLSRVGG